MNKTQEALKLALEALEYIDRQDNDRDFLSPEECCDLDDAITAIREASAEQPAQQQEPVAYMNPDDLEKMKRFGRGSVAWATPTDFCTQPVYTSPPASKPWVGLTDEEMHECWGDPLTPLGMKHARAIEAKLREKNA